jgi:PAS domain S-box-containing protein
LVLNTLQKTFTHPTLEISQYEYRLITPANGLRWVTNYSKREYDHTGKLVAMSGLLQDITERKIAEAAQRENERKYRDLINGMNDTVWVLDIDTRILEVNDTVVKLLGYTREELLTLRVADIDANLASNQIKHLLDLMYAVPENLQVFETHHRAKDGRVIPVEVSSSFITYMGKPAVMSIARDITEREIAQENLLFAERQYRLQIEMALKGVQAGMWDWHVPTGAITVNERWVAISGYTLAELAPVSLTTWHHLCHPDDLQRSNAILVEDIAANIMVVQQYLESLGYTVHTATHGQAALDYVRVQQPDLILMDIQMPVMDGLEATRRLRMQPELDHIPIIALTALVMPGDRERCLEAGANDYIGKPLKLKQLAERIRQFLRP